MQRRQVHGRRGQRQAGKKGWLERANKGGGEIEKEKLANFKITHIPYFYISSPTTLSQFEKLAAAVGMPELSKDPRFRTNRDRTKHRKVLVDLLQTFFMTKTRAELDAIFEVCFGVEGGADKAFFHPSSHLLSPPPLLFLHSTSHDNITVYHLGNGRPAVWSAP